MLTNEQITAAQQAQLKALHELSAHYLSSVEKLTALNLKLSQDTLNDSSRQAQAHLNFQDGQNLMSLPGSSLQPYIERATAYSRQLMDIFSHWGQGVAEVLQTQRDQVRESLTQSSDKVYDKIGKVGKTAKSGN